MRKHIGIVACSSEGAALCYRTLCLEAGAQLGEHYHPEVSLHGFSLGKYMEYIEARDWLAVAELMLSSARKLATGGAELLICPDNTIHQAWPLVLDRIPLPWLHIAAVVAAEARARDFRRLAVLGTRSLMESQVYPQQLRLAEIEWCIPSEAERADIDAIIFDELVQARVYPESRLRAVEVIRRLRVDEGCDAVVLGCTELPLLISQADSPLPLLDSTRLLARAALRT
ncbi:MAG TPA: amino acid racemase [Polyangiales bacterium]|nr:amino acid racemase [Polyangiales bacterium]